ncbi:uncharacterized protein K452DRAFT_223982, partial [Aplosporella prunicola CBS 121167]
MEYQRLDDRRGVILDTEWIRTDTLLHWLKYCDKHHRGHCTGRPEWLTISNPLRILLIDVQQECLVEGSIDVDYFALSYVWGYLGHTLETRKGNLEILKKAGSLKTEMEDTMIPETIKDSIRLVRKLGCQFLWVDRLCIVQDDEENKKKHIDAMGSIYSQAYCTIVDAGGSNAGFGLPGVGNGSKPRNYPKQHVLDFPGCPMLLVHSEVNPSHDSVWSTRGWTFQEEKLSKRQLVFGKNTVSYDCSQDHRDEYVTEPVNSKVVLKTKISMIPDLKEWTNSVANYNRRNLTFDDDTRNAFAGFEEVLRPYYPGGFCYGLPVCYFDIGLLWRPGTRFRRRHSSVGKESNYLPSWSWMGWQG